MYQVIKRTFDFLLSLFMVILLSPILLVLALSIKLDSRGPVFFKQSRVGKNKKLFLIYKFRTMRTDAPKDVPTHLLNAAESYITKSGAFLRKTSLDELAQLFNILKGDMSFVGPRPALYNQDDLIAARDLYGANNVPVGLTGWAQVNGRDELPIDVKAKLDGEYVTRCGFWFDLKIIALTALSVFRHKGVVEGGTGALEKPCEPASEKRV